MDNFKSKYDRQELEELVQQYTHKEIAEMKGTTSQYITRLCTRWNIRTPTWNERNNKRIITPIMKQLIIGSVLGDAHIAYSKTIDAYYRAEQGSKQKDYLFWKYEILKYLCASSPRKSVREYTSWYFNTRTHKYFTKIHKLFYSSLGEKKVPNNFSKFLTPIVSAVWYMDDGTCSTNHLELCVQGYSILDILIIRKAFKNNFNINLGITRRHDKRLEGACLSFTICGENMIKFIRLIKPYIIPSMLYKIT